MRGRRGRSALCALVVSTSFATTGCDLLRPEPEKKRVETTAEEDEQAALSPPPAKTSSSKKPIVVYDMPDKPERKDAGLIEKPQPLVLAIRDELGPSARVLGVSIFQDYAHVEARDPRQPKKKRSFTFRGEALREASFKSAIEHDPEDLARKEFGLDEIEWGNVPQLSRTALEKWGAKPGEMTRLAVLRPPLAKNVELRFHISQAQGDGFVAFSTKGKLLEVHRP